MHLPTTSSQRNLDEFLHKHGRNGVLVLFFANLLEEMARGEFLNTIDKQASNSPGIVHYLDHRGRTLSAEKWEEKKSALRAQCIARASVIVQKMEVRGSLDSFDGSRSLDPDSLKGMTSTLRDIMEDVFGAEWGSKT